MLANAVLHHAAVAARRIRDLLPIYQGLLGGRFLNGGDNPEIGFRAVQLGFSEGTRVEVMEPLAGSTFLDAFLHSRPEGGLHHLTFLVEDIEAALAEARSQGYHPVGVRLDSTVWREIFLHPREGRGLLVQLAEPGPDYTDVLVSTTIEDVLDGRGQHGTGVPSP